MGLIKKLVQEVAKPLTVVGAVVGAVTGIGAVAGIAGSLLLNNSLTTSNTDSGTTTEVVNDTNVFIPAMTIPFEGNLFKPNTRLYVFFDGRDVTQYIQPDGLSEGAPLVTDSTGHIKGEFHLPNTNDIRFTQGKKEFKFTDSSKNDTTETTYSVSYFTYSGSEDKSASQDIGGIQSSTAGVDPTVQTFLVLDKGGIYLKSINLYFMSKDSKYPVLFQIREVQDDTVSDLYLTNSNFVLNPSDININSDGSIPTTVTLHAPLYLQEGKIIGE